MTMNDSEIVNCEKTRDEASSPKSLLNQNKQCETNARPLDDDDSSPLEQELHDGSKKGASPKEARIALNALLREVERDVRRTRGYVALQTPLIIARVRHDIADCGSCGGSCGCASCTKCADDWRYVLGRARKRQRIVHKNIFLSRHNHIDLESHNPRRISLDYIAAKCEGAVYENAANFLRDYASLRDQIRNAQAALHARLLLETAEEYVARLQPDLRILEKSLREAPAGVPPAIGVGEHVEVFRALDHKWHRARIEELLRSYARIAYRPGREIEWINLADRTCWRPCTHSLPDDHRLDGGNVPWSDAD